MRQAWEAAWVNAEAAAQRKAGGEGNAPARPSTVPARPRGGQRRRGGGGIGGGLRGRRHRRTSIAGSVISGGSSAFGGRSSARTPLALASLGGTGSQGLGSSTMVGSAITGRSARARFVGLQPSASKQWQRAALQQARLERQNQEAAGVDTTAAAAAAAGGGTRAGDSRGGGRAGRVQRAATASARLRDRASRKQAGADKAESVAASTAIHIASTPGVGGVRKLQLPTARARVRAQQQTSMLCKAIMKKAAQKFRTEKVRQWWRRGG